MVDGGAWRRVAVSVVVLAVAWGGAGCSGDAGPAPSASPSVSLAVSVPSISPLPTPTPTVTTIPDGMSAKERAAAESAIDVYLAYERAIEDARSGTGDSKALLTAVAISGELDSQSKEVAQWRIDGRRVVGRTETRWVKAISVSFKTDASTFTVPEVQLSSCTDSNSTDVVDSEGNSILSTPAPQRIFRNKIWVRRYPEPKNKFDQWFVARVENEKVSSC